MVTAKPTGNASCGFEKKDAKSAEDGLSSGSVVPCHGEVPACRAAKQSIWLDHHGRFAPLAMTAWVRYCPSLAPFAIFRSKGATLRWLRSLLCKIGSSAAPQCAVFLPRGALPSEELDAVADFAPARRASSSFSGCPPNCFATPDLFSVAGVFFFMSQRIARACSAAHPAEPGRKSGESETGFSSVALVILRDWPSGSGSR